MPGVWCFHLYTLNESETILTKTKNIYHFEIRQCHANIIRRTFFSSSLMINVKRPNIRVSCMFGNVF